MVSDFSSYVIPPETNISLPGAKNTFQSAYPMMATAIAAIVHLTQAGARLIARFAAL